MRHLLTGAAMALAMGVPAGVLFAPAPAAAVVQAEEAGVERTATGVIVTPAEGPARRVRLRVMGPRIIHVTATPAADFANLPDSLMVTAEAAETGFEVTTRGGHVFVSTPEMTAEVSRATGRVRFLDANGEVMLAEREGGREISPFMVEDQDGVHSFHSVRQLFEAAPDEAIYGLGQHQQGLMNQRGADVELTQHNIDSGVPFMTSSRGYGVLWENNSLTRFGDPREYGMLDQRLIVRDSEGNFGGLTASYFQDGELALSRIENQINYEFIRDHQRWPPGFKVQPGQPAQVGDMGRSGQPGVTVTWEGTLEPTVSGEHKFRLYASSYVKVWVDGELVMDRWRQNWNPWNHDFQIQMEAGRRVPIRVEWIPNDGYLALRHLDPLPAEQDRALSLWSEVGHAVDYYFVGGENLDQVIAGYRDLTGEAVMMPRWAYGFWQSRQRYNTQDEVLAVAEGYRSRNLPIDNIVQDWFYWPENAWGSHEFEASRFPDPGGMVDQLHDQNINIMISVWPKFYPTTEHYRELAAIGGMYTRNVEVGARDWVGPGYNNSFYDPYHEEARALYWRQIREHLHGLGFDGWWLDSVEPDMHSNLDRRERTLRMGPTAAGPAALVFNSYPLVNAEGVYEGLREAQPDRRAYILTRAAWGGLQRTASTLWSGDVVPRWDDLREQISAGVQVGLSGIPNWTHDIGGFSVEERYTTEDITPEDQAEWRELNLRWFQFGAFTPIFRSHGEYPYREVWEIAPEGTEVYEALGDYLRLRYRLMPYIYTLGAEAYHRDGTIMRGLVMDFPQDERAREVNDQFMFGRAFLVAPVHQHEARSRQVWLPRGADWYDFNSGARHTGGQAITADAPLARMPLFVRSGSIVPTGPAIQHTAEALDGPITLNVYVGADGSFDLYSDEGTTYGYERGAFATMPITWDDAAGVLTIGARQGAYPGMPASRTVHVRFIDGSGEAPWNVDAAPQQTVTYAGSALTVRR
ncbi:TIM-barrel domain-containing protein [Brevundimonas sp.]|uniref:TIM-barrel domain-containing protein n=1 Tax=Brevundimonas sp. TaxID=1871086 RepID=UPI001DDB90DF|nr:TIM-barrel domain-containing protein [Brevundimonas sp.]MBA4001180.1 alpha-xylosidase [Brevundimonas sp.]